MTRRFLIAFAVLSIGSLTAADEHFNGTWKLNAAKSTSSGPTWKSRTLTISVDGETRKFKSEGVTSDGQQLTGGYEAKTDGKDYPMSGNVTGADTIALTQKGAGGPISYTLKKGGKVVASGRTTVSADGKTLTIQAKGTTAEGKAYTSKGVYDKQ